MYPYNYKRGQTIQSDAGVPVDRFFGARVHLSAEQAAAASANGVRVVTLGAAAQMAAGAVTTGITSPPAPRNLSIVGNKANSAGDVVISGTNYAGEAISETLALNGTTTAEGAKAFKTVTKIEVPAQVNTPVKQVETATAAGTVTTAGNALVTVTSALFEEAIAVDVPVVLDDDAAAIALAIRTALAADPDISAHFDVSGATDKVILTAKVAAANDATLNIAIDDGSGDGASAGVTTAANSANTTAGVAPDTVSVGWGDKLGLPYKLAHNTILAAYLNNAKEAVAATVAVSATALESNTADLNSALDGHVVDIYLVV